MKKIYWAILVVVAHALMGCAQVPRESLQISQTLGRDLAEVQRAHLGLVELHFDRLEGEVEKFVRTVYAPYQIQRTLADENIGGVLVKEISAMSNGGITQQQANNVAKILAVYVEELQLEIEAYRVEKVSPLKIQRAAVIEKISETYMNMQMANAATTGYLSSLVQVRDIQNELLEKAGAPNMQNKIAEDLSKASDAIAKLNSRVASGRSQFIALQTELDDILKKVRDK